jgi:hypothetical protein
MVMHFDDGRYFVMPISGRHTRSICGLSFQDSYKPNNKRHTKNKCDVTCKKCLKNLAHNAKVSGGGAFSPSA